jgi:hypothetical protein
MVVPRVLGLVTRAPAPVNELSAAKKKKAKKSDLGSTDLSAKKKKSPRRWTHEDRDSLSHRGLNSISSTRFALA